MTAPLNVAITGAAGQIGYALIFRVAAGALLGPDGRVNLHLLEITPALPALQGVVMELNDCAFPTLNRVVATDDATVAFRDCQIALLVGARPRGPGMERKDLLLANAQIFSAQGKALNEVADRKVRVLTVGNPANTNALIARANARDLNPRNFTAMTRLDHNRALWQLAEKTGAQPSEIRRMTIWGNHSSTQYPDLRHAEVAGKPAKSLVSQQWIEESFIPVVQQRGAAVIKARGASSAASAASAVIDHMRSWLNGTGEGDWVSMAVPSDGSYGIPEGVVYSYPVTLAGGEYRIVPGLAVDEFSRKRMDATLAELREEREGIKALLGRSFAAAGAGGYSRVSRREAEESHAGRYRLPVAGGGGRLRGHAGGRRHHAAVHRSGALPRLPPPLAPRLHHDLHGAPCRLHGARRRRRPGRNLEGVPVAAARGAVASQCAAAAQADDHAPVHEDLPEAPADHVTDREGGARCGHGVVGRGALHRRAALVEAAVREGP